jgi:hypothetical protein
MAKRNDVQTFGAMQSARMAQIRRDRAEEVANTHGGDKYVTEVTSMSRGEIFTLPSFGLTIVF